MENQELDQILYLNILVRRSSFMVKENDLEFLIESSNLPMIVESMRSDFPDPPQVIMLDRIIRRTLYKVPLSSESSAEKVRWLRIMDGDIESDLQPRCTVTYKDKMKNMSDEEKSVLKVDNYDDAIHLFDLLHYEKVSYQENRRSKFACSLDQVKYIVKFDIWPKIEDVTFVSVSFASSANENSMSNFIDLLGLKEFNICRNQRADVDEEYKKRLGKPAMSIPMLTFDFDF